MRWIGAQGRVLQGARGRREREALACRRNTNSPHDVGRRDLVVSGVERSCVALPEFVQRRADIDAPEPAELHPTAVAETRPSSHHPNPDLVQPQVEHAPRSRHTPGPRRCGFPTPRPSALPLASSCVVCYNYCDMQPTVAGLRRRAVQEFRRDLRVLEREILRQLEGETGCCGVSLPQCHVLLELSFGDLSLKSLADALNLDKSTLSRTVEAMVREGMVTRDADARDRRAVRLTLSARGRAKVATINETCDRYYEALLAKMHEADRQKVTLAVRLLADGMRQLRGCSSVAELCCAPASSATRPSTSRSHASTVPRRSTRQKGRAK
jgi:DNA-binding MarR family transcriptional regulator